MERQTLSARYSNRGTVDAVLTSIFPKYKYQQFFRENSKGFDIVVRRCLYCSRIILRFIAVQWSDIVHCAEAFDRGGLIRLLFWRSLLTKCIGWTRVRASFLEDLEDERADLETQRYEGVQLIWYRESPGGWYGGVAHREAPCLTGSYEGGCVCGRLGGFSLLSHDLYWVESQFCNQALMNTYL